MTNSPAGQGRQTTREAVLNRPLPPKIPDAEFTPDPMSSFRVGDRIEHNRFGVGKVLEITGQVPEIKAKIIFDKFGEKILLLKYAKIRHV
jgi:DNA helicase-2/ATP-dependent DNA helicase PcrA